MLITGLIWVAVRSLGPCRRHSFLITRSSERCRNIWISEKKSCSTSEQIGQKGTALAAMLCCVLSELSRVWTGAIWSSFWANHSLSKPGCRNNMLNLWGVLLKMRYLKVNITCRVMRAGWKDIKYSLEYYWTYLHLNICITKSFTVRASEPS